MLLSRLGYLFDSPLALSFVLSTFIFLTSAYISHSCFLLSATCRPLLHITVQFLIFYCLSIYPQNFSHCFCYPRNNFKFLPHKILQFYRVTYSNITAYCCSLHFKKIVLFSEDGDSSFSGSFYPHTRLYIIESKSNHALIFHIFLLAFFCTIPLNFLTKTLYPQISFLWNIVLLHWVFVACCFHRSGLRLKRQVSKKNVFRKVRQETPTDGAQLHGTSTISNAPLSNPEILRLIHLQRFFFRFPKLLFLCVIFMQFPSKIMGYSTYKLRDINQQYTVTL